MKTLSELEQYAIEGDVAALKRHMCLDNQTTILGLLQAASNAGRVDCVQYLLPFADMSRDKGSSLYLAVYNQHHDCVDVLLPTSVMSNDMCDELMSLVFNKGDVKMMSRLAQHQQYVSLNVMRRIVTEGHCDVVQELIPFFDVSQEQSLLLAVAAFQERYDVFEILYPLSNASDAVQHLEDISSRYSSDDATIAKQYIISCQEKDALEKELKNTGVASATRKM